MTTALPDPRAGLVVGLRLLDLRKPGPGRRIALPRSVRALDAEVVRVP